MNLKPIGDKVLIKLIEVKETFQGGLYIPDSHNKNNIQTGTIIAIGNGIVNGQDKIEFEIKIGDTVLFSLYSITEIKSEDGKYALVRYEEIIGIVEEEK